MFTTDSAAAAPWPELDRRLLQIDRRAAPPPFPIEAIPEAWRPWTEGHAQASTCTDYIAQALLAAVSAVCGSRFVVDVTPHWREPLLLWQALVGASSTGKTAAFVAGRRLLSSVTAPADPPVDDPKPPAGALPLTSWTVHRGLSSWHDSEAWITGEGDAKYRPLALGSWSGDPAHSLAKPFDVGQRGVRYPESILVSVRAERLAETLGAADDALLSRLLYCWPVPRLEARFDRASDGFESVCRLLQRLVNLPGTVNKPAALALEEAAADHLEALLPRLRAFMRDADGLEAAWIGKAAGNIVRLAGLLCLMDWAQTDSGEPCTIVEEQHVERAKAMWTDYFWPHAKAVFGQTAATLIDRRVQRVGRWLRRTRPETVSREEVRREGLGQSVDADTTESVIERLERQGVLRMLPIVKDSRRGPRRVRWQVNPELWAN